MIEEIQIQTPDGLKTVLVDTDQITNQGAPSGEALEKFYQSMDRHSLHQASKEFTRFESVAEWIEKVDTGGSVDRKLADHRWNGGESGAESVRKARQGDTSMVEQAEALMEEVFEELEIDDQHPQWRNEVAGFIPDVPAYLAGQPQSMRLLAPVTAPHEVNVYYTGTCSAGIRAEVMLKRGIAALALAMILSQTRAVNFYYYTSHGKGDQLIRLATNPLNLSESAYAISSPGFTRNLTYSYSRDRGWCGHWASWFSFGNGWESCERLRVILDLSPTDLIIPPIFNTEGDTVNKDPAAWIRGHLKRFNEIQELVG